MRGLLVAFCSMVIVGCHAPTPAETDEKPNAPQPSGTIGGTVRAPDRPLADARVCARRQILSHDVVPAELEPICVSTDAAGHFTLSVGPGVFVVVAAAEGHVPRAEEVLLREHERGAIRTFELVPGGRRYEGTVLDIDGRPIVDATISHTSADLDVSTVVETRTDAQGNFALWSARAGELSARALGYARKAIVTPDQRRWVLAPESTIRGVVVDRERNPVAGALVWSGDRGVRTDERGHFHLTQLEPGEHTLTATTKNQSRVDRVAVGFADHRKVTLTLVRPLSQHRARVVDVETGTAVPGCRLNLSSDGWHDVEGWTDEMGLFDRPLVGTYRLSAVECPGYVASRPFRPIGPDLAAPTPVEVRRGVEVHGTVLDDAQQPVAGLWVALVPTYATEGRLYRRPRAITDGTGRFSITGLPAIEFEFIYEQASERVLMKIDGEQVYREFQVPSAGRVEVEVDADAIGRYVRLLDCNGEAVEMTWTAKVESDRLAVFERVPVGTHQVDFPDRSWDPARCNNRQLRVEARTTTRLRVELGAPERESLHVRVLDQDDVPVAGAVVGHTGGSWLPGPREWSWEHSDPVVTDASGRTLLTHDSDTTIVVMAARPGLYGVDQADVDLDEVTIRLQPIESE